MRSGRSKLRPDGRVGSKGKSVTLSISVELGTKGLDFERADIKFTGIEQAGESFEGRVFLNNPAADESTPTTKQHGYAGSFHVYGYGLWPGDIGKERLREEAPREIARAPIEKVVIATEALRTAAAHGPEILITVVPVYPGQPPRSAFDAMTLQDAQIIIE